MDLRALKSCSVSGAAWRLNHAYPCSRMVLRDFHTYRMDAEEVLMSLELGGIHSGHPRVDRHREHCGAPGQSSARRTKVTITACDQVSDPFTLIETSVPDLADVLLTTTEARLPAFMLSCHIHLEPDVEGKLA